MNECVLIQNKLALHHDPQKPYVEIQLTVPPGVGMLRFSGIYTSSLPSQLPVALYDPEKTIRSIFVHPYSKGTVSLGFWISEGAASKGGIQGPIQAGAWTLLIFIRKLHDPTELDFSISYVKTENLDIEHGADATGNGLHIPSTQDCNYATTVDTEKDSSDELFWVQGDLHAHSIESTGELSVTDTLKHLHSLGFDFQALTDHFTISHWRKQIPFKDSLILLNSCEIPGLYGHANVHGIKQWIDPFVDRPEWDMNAVAQEVHAQGGLFCVNHPFNGLLGWNYHDFDWNLADMIEVYNPPEGPNFLLQIMFWDHLLLSGYRVVGVAGSDTHNPKKTGTVWEVTTLRNFVQVTARTQKALIEGIRKGRVLISLGARMEFSLIDSSKHVHHMFEQAEAGQTIRLQISLYSKESGKLFIIKNGLCFTVLEVNGSHEDQSFYTEVPDRPTHAGYYRVEFHANYSDGFHTGIVWRDHSTMRALSNPIFIAETKGKVTDDHHHTV